MKHVGRFPLIFLVFLTTAASPVFAQEKVFRTHLVSVPQSFDPAHFYGTETAFFFSQVFRGLYRYDTQKGLVPEGAKKCFYKTNLKVICELNPDFKFSDNTAVTAQDYVRSFQHLLNPDSKSRENSQLIKLKNAKKILKGDAKLESLGISSKGDFILEFDFDEYDNEFIDKLISPVLIAWKELPNIQQPEKIISNGPYKVEKLSQNQKVTLVPNPYYPFGNKNRPKVEIYFLDEDSTIQNLYDLGKLDFITRLDLTQYEFYKKQKGMIRFEFSKFDYFGFGPEIQNASIHLRKALSLSLNFQELIDMFHTSRIGCVGISQELFEKESCYQFDLTNAKLALSKVPKKELEKTYILKYSLAGGDNVHRAVQWFQNQWKKNLGLKIQLEPQEQGMYLQTLKNNTPDIFRKGINLDRHTCLSALENFHSQSNDNYIHLNSKEFDSIVKLIGETRDRSRKKKLCQRGIDILMSEYRLIPQGVIAYDMLSNGKFKGIEYNKLNQLNLSNLEVVP